MLILAATTDKFQVISSSTADLDVHVSYIDLNSSTGAFSGGGKQNTAINTAATTDILAAPAATTLRNAKTIQIRNKHASSSNTVTVQFNQNATLYELHKVTLAAGEALEYIEGVGFFVLGATLPTAVARVTGSDATTTGQSLVDVTGLSLALAINSTYLFACRMTVTTTAVTTGTKYGVQYSVAGGAVEAGFLGSLTATASMVSERISALNTATTTAILTTSAQSGIAWIDGQVTTGANAGNLTIQHLKVTSGTSTVKIGSSLQFWKVG